MPRPHIPSKNVAAVAQFAALPFRWHRSGELEVMLITSRGSRQWIIPKGKPIEGLTAAETAAQEAYEEAGLIGEIGVTEIGQFAYTKDKGLETKRLIPAVIVFPFEFIRQLTLWPEMGQRQTSWFDARQAAALVEIPDLRKIILDFAFDAEQ